MPFQKGHKGFRTLESYRKAGIKIASNPNSKKTQFKRGFTPWSKSQKGVHLSPKSEFKKGRTPWNKGLPKEKSPLFGRKMSLEHRAKIGLAQKGVRNHNWKGGITPLRTQIYHTYQYKKWLSDILARDDYTCTICDKRGGEMAGDHYPKAFSQIIREFGIESVDQSLTCAELWDLCNGRTLCRPCHLKTDNYGGRIKRM